MQITFLILIDLSSLTEHRWYGSSKLSPNFSSRSMHLLDFEWRICIWLHHLYSHHTVWNSSMGPLLIKAARLKCVSVSYNLQKPSSIYQSLYSDSTKYIINNSRENFSQTQCLTWKAIGCSCRSSWKSPKVMAKSWQSPTQLPSLSQAWYESNHTHTKVAL